MALTASAVVATGVTLGASPAAAAPPTVTAAGPPAAAAPILPNPTSTLATPDQVKRDCGFSTELNGGRAFWIFCDSTDLVELVPDDPLTPGNEQVLDFDWFRQNTAAISMPGTPLQVEEAVNMAVTHPDGGHPAFEFIPARAANNRCLAVLGAPPPPSTGWRYLVWPMSMTKIPGPNGRDRVVVYYRNTCAASGTLADYVPMSIGVGHYDTDPNDPTPADSAIVLTEDANLLWGIDEPSAGSPNAYLGITDDPSQFGEGAVAGNGFIYTYRCSADPTTGNPLDRVDEWGCQVNRVPQNSYATASAYEYYNAGTNTWGPTQPVAQSSAITMGAPPGGGLDAGVPTDDFNVQYEKDWGLYMMGATGELGTYTDIVDLRVAETPEGPWTSPLHVQHSVCAEAPKCYSGFVHSHLTDADSVGLGIMDKSYWFPQRGLQVVLFDQPLTFGPPITSTCFSGFTDVPDTHTFCDEIAWFKDQGITTGYADGTFKPGRNVTRGAMAAWFYRWAGSPAGPIPNPGFSDVTTANPFYREISWLVQSGIATGYADGTYKSSAPVSRQAMAAWFHRADTLVAGHPDVPAPNPGFSDVPTSNQFYDDIAWLANSGITSGYPDGTYRPVNQVTRQAIAAFFYRYAGN